MKALLVTFSIFLILLTSGCVRETGDLVINFTELEFSGPDNDTEPQDN